MSEVKSNGVGGQLDRDWSVVDDFHAHIRAESARMDAVVADFLSQCCDIGVITFICESGGGRIIKAGSEAFPRVGIEREL